MRRNTGSEHNILTYFRYPIGYRVSTGQYKRPKLHFMFDQVRLQIKTNSTSTAVV